VLQKHTAASSIGTTVLHEGRGIPIYTQILVDKAGEKRVAQRNIAGPMLLVVNELGIYAAEEVKPRNLVQILEELFENTP